MSQIPPELKYVKTHEWLELLADGTVKVGITDHAQEMLGDMVYVELPEVGRELNAGDECGVVESVKAASDVYIPLTGRIVEVNETVTETPETVNSDPYGDGWLYRLKVGDSGELDGLLDADGYAAVLAEESED